MVSYASKSQTNFTFTLNRSFRTSAGVFKTDGTLVRALWKDVTYPQGTFTSTWDNKDDMGVLQGSGNYQVKVLYHNVNYVWDGSIGQTATLPYGTHTYKGYHTFQSFAACDTAIYYTMGYNEMVYDLHWFPLSNIKNPTGFFNSDNFTAIGLVATDGIMLYSSDNQGGYGATGARSSFIWANKLNTPNKDIYNWPATLNRKILLNGPLRSIIYYGIDYDTTSVAAPIAANAPGGHPFTQNSASGLAVQITGNILAVSHFTANQIRLFNKTSGNLLSVIAATGPEQVCFSSEGDLWAIVNGTVVRYATPGTTPTIVTTITTLKKPLGICVDPTNPNILLVADGSTSQQVKAFDKLGNSLWVLGEYNSYPAGGTQVRNEKFWFFDASQGEKAFICILKDHSFWLSDNFNNRVLHFTSGIPSFIEQIISQPASYGMSIDANDPTKVMSSFQEFKIDYTKPLSSGWTYVKNWAANMDKVASTNFAAGIRQLVTDSTSGKSFGLIGSFTVGYQVVVLPHDRSGNIKYTGTVIGKNGNYSTTLNKDLSYTMSPMSGTTGVATNFLKFPIPTIDTSGALTYGISTVLASPLWINSDPLPRCCGLGDIKTPVSSSNILLSYTQAKSPSYWHLGGIKLGATAWLWKSARLGSLDRKGTYDIGHGSSYQGDALNSIDRNLVCGYHGEFWNQSQAGQFMHYYDDGLFVGQFGNSSYGYPYQVGSIPGFVGNGFSSVMCKANGEIYLWTNDENCNGPQRWHLVGANNIHELAGTVALNGNGTLSFLN